MIGSTKSQWAHKLQHKPQNTSAQLLPHTAFQNSLPERELEQGKSMKIRGLDPPCATGWFLSPSDTTVHQHQHPLV